MLDHGFLPFDLRMLCYQKTDLTKISVFHSSFYLFEGGKVRVLDFEILIWLLLFGF